MGVTAPDHRSAEEGRSGAGGAGGRGNPRWPLRLCSCMGAWPYRGPSTGGGVGGDGRGGRRRTVTGDGASPGGAAVRPQGWRRPGLWQRVGLGRIDGQRAATGDGEQEVEEAEAAVRNEMAMHHNHPSLEIH
uniref:DUF834 domain-containing protein n=1 Tax=Setaria viridis TaxID=4556 RepID=A0A4U6TMU0_SETVI|nr:hypothetical protein SEVIR_8G207500v2 [Setaria viridis]TKW01870.1 hypothetical protein SEVIR_8G207500v2 [Setaria viridis]